MKPDFLIIPKILIDNKNLAPSDSIVYAIVYWFERMKEGKCIASNETIAGVANLKNRAVRSSLERLENEGYVKRVFADKNHKTRIEIKTLIAFSKVGMNEPTRRSNHDRKVGPNVPQSSKMRSNTYTDIQNLKKLSEMKNRILRGSDIMR